MPAAAAAVNHGVLAIIEHGILAGTIGAFIVAVWFLMFDAARGEPFFTPSLIGSVIFLGKSVEEVSAVNTAMVFAYTGLHGFLFLIAGTVIAWMFALIERKPQLGLVLLLVFLLFQSVLFGFEVTILPNLVGALGASAVALANLISALAMFYFLLRRRPEAIARLRAGWEE